MMMMRLEMMWLMMIMKSIDDDEVGDEVDDDEVDDDYEIR